MEQLLIAFQPQSLRDIVGNAKNIKEIEAFLKGYPHVTRRALVLEGPTGTGKTAAVIAAARELNLELIEINASDFRNEAGIMSTAGEASKQRSLFSEGKIILVDEVDGLSGREDRGGVGAVVKLIDASGFPVILTGNDISDSKFSPVRKKVKRLAWEKPTPAEIEALLKKIAATQKIHVEDAVLKVIAHKTNGDIRAAVTDLEIAASLGHKITMKDLDSIGERYPHDSISRMLISIFKNKDPKIALEALDLVVEDPDECLLWIDENLPNEYKAAKDLAKAYGFVSKADLFRGRIIKRQYWRYLVYMTAFMSAGVAVSKEAKNPTMIAYKRSDRILKMWIANQKFASRKAFAKAMVPNLHASYTELVQHTAPLLKELARKEPDFVQKLKERYKLDDAQVAWLEK